MAPKKGFKYRLKSAARLPVVRVAAGRGSGRNAANPIPGENPLVFLRVQVVACANLLSKDRNGLSDPFVVASLLNIRHQTPVAKKTVNPTYGVKDATFDFPIYVSTADRLGALELVVWDKDIMSKDYLGEAALPLDDWFEDLSGAARPWTFEESKPFSLNLESTRANTHATGSVQIQIGFYHPRPPDDVAYDAIYSELLRRSRPSVVSAPPTEGYGTIRSSLRDPAFEDDGLPSDEESDEDDYVDASEGPSTPLSELYTPPTTTTTTDQSELQRQQAKALPQLNILPSSPNPDMSPDFTQTPTAKTPLSALIPTSAAPPKSPKTPSSPGFKKFGIPLPRRISGLSHTSSASNLNTPPSTVPSPAPAQDPVTGALIPGTPASAPDTESEGNEKDKKKRFSKSFISGNLSDSAAEPSGRRRRKSREGYKLAMDAADDIVGIVMLEIQSADDLPKFKNMTRTGWDMDPFVVVSFSKKVFRTRVVRHSLNPVWDEKLLFHVRRYETSFQVQLSILDWDKLSSNDHIGDASFNVNELIKNAPQPDSVTGLYDKNEKGEHDLTEMKLSLMGNNGSAWDSKFNPVIKIRAKYQPYDALRQTFWRTYLKQYDTDDTDTISHLELTSMLDSLNSTLTRSTIHSFFTRNNKEPHKDELTFDEVIQCLETELRRPDSEKRKIEDASEGGGDGLDSSVSPTPFKDNNGRLDLDKLDFSGPPHVGMPHDDKKPFISGPYQTEPSELPLQNAGEAVKHTGQRQASFNSMSSSSEDAGEDSSSSGIPSSPSIGEAVGQAGDASVPTPKAKKTRLRRRKKTLVAKEASSTSASSMEDPFERVINVKNCPLCHRPRLSSKAERDIVTHLAVCASQDWGKVDNIMVGNFVTASQAQRKWYTKIISKVSSGDYKLGANSANIIVQNRITGQLEEEKMQVYVRLGIRLLYKGASSRMEGVRARKLLKSLSIKQGIKYDSPESARDIPVFVEFHGLNVDEILDPLDSFRTFNEFFYRKLKPTARPIDEPDDPYRLVSAADCRMMTFPSVDEATRLWIKGRDFTVRKLLGEAYANQVDRYVGGALAIFRLAPQDYHRFHSPVEGTIGKMTYIAGEYYTVNPQAIRTALDVYGENARKIVPIDSPQFGRVMAVCVGAMMVGSIKTTVKEGDFVHRGQEFGYFAFGGSTIVVLFEKGAVEWDEDLVINGKASLETLVRVGMGIGHGRRQQDTYTFAVDK